MRAAQRDRLLVLSPGDAQAPPHLDAALAQAPPLDEIVVLIAALGGDLKCMHDGPPGPKTFRIGLKRVRELVIACEARDSVQGRCV